MTNGWLTSTSPLIIGHRGASAFASENTLEAFSLAVEQGAHGIELDVRLSADGVPFIIHDARLDRSTDGSGAVSKWTSDQIRQLRTSDNQQVPTLDQLFGLLGQNTLYNIELKSFGWNRKPAEEVVATINRHDLADNCLISSFSPLALSKVSRACSGEIPVALIHSTNLAKYAFPFVNARAVHPEHTLVTQQYLTWAKDRSIRIHTWTVDRSEEALRLASLGVDAIITNRPVEILGAISSLN